MVALLAGAWWLWRMLGLIRWIRLARRHGRRRNDPVRREAGQWLVRFARVEGAAPVSSPPRTAARVSVVADLQRLRYGAPPTWPEPGPVFRQARRALREKRRQARR